MKKRYIIFLGLLFLFFINRVNAETYNICAASGTATRSGNTITWRNITVPYNYSNTQSYTASFIGTADSVDCNAGQINYEGADIKINGLANGYVNLATNVPVNAGTLSITSTNFKRYLVFVDSNASNLLRTYVDIGGLLDSVSPTISNCHVYGQTTTSYNVACTVSDNVGVVSVKFPTWTNANGQDDLIWHEGYINGNTAAVTIQTSQHNNEAGLYITHVYAYDAAGNVGTGGISTTIDRTPPTCTNSGDSTTWTSGNRTIYYGCSDASGCNSSYSGGSKIFNTTTKTSSIPSYTIKDIYGNTTNCPARTANVYVDKSAPVISGIATSNKSTNYINAVVNYTEPETNISKYEFRINGGEWKTSTSNNYKFTGLSSDTEYTIEVRLTNSVGLSSTYSVKDSTDILSVPTFKINTEQWASKKTLTINYPNISGIEKTYSLDDGNTWNVYNGPIEVSDNITVIAKASDNVNTKTSSYLVSNIDTTGPNIYLSTSNRTTTKITSVVSAVDDETGVSACYIKLDDGDWADLNDGIYIFEKLKNKNYKITVRCINGVGISNEKVMEDVKPLDLDVPQISVSPNTTTWALKRTVTITYPKGYEGEVYRHEYSVDNGNTWLKYENPIEFDKSGTIMARIVDSADNIGSSNSYVITNVGKGDYCDRKSTIYEIDNDGNIILDDEIIKIPIKGKTMNGGFICLNKNFIATKARLIRGNFILNYDGNKITIGED